MHRPTETSLVTNMTNEEQQRIDRAIVEGRHVEAMILYRVSTGVEFDAG